MFISKWRFAAILAAVIGVFGLGAIGHNLAFQGAPAPAAKKVPKELLEKRRDAAKGAWEIKLAIGKRAFAPKGNFNPKISDLLGWSERWLDAELPLCEKKAERIAALKAHVDRTRKVEQMAMAIEKFAGATTADIKAATYERLNAEIRYFEETGKTPPPPDNEELPKPQEKKGEKRR